MSPPHAAPPPSPDALPDSIARSIEIDAPVERVWSALTEARHLGSWFGDAGAEIDLAPGGSLVVRWREHGTALGVVEEVDRPRVFSFRWSLIPDDPPRPGNETRVRFTLEPLGPATTRLTVVESGFRSLGGGDAERRRHLDQNTSGWRAEFGELSAYLAPSLGSFPGASPGASASVSPGASPIPPSGAEPR